MLRHTLVPSAGHGASCLALAPQVTNVDFGPGGLKDCASERSVTVKPGAHDLVQVCALGVLVGAALFGRSLAGLRQIEPGFDRNNVLLFTVRPAMTSYRLLRGEALCSSSSAHDLARLPGRDRRKSVDGRACDGRWPRAGEPSPAREPGNLTARRRPGPPNRGRILLDCAPARSDASSPSAIAGAPKVAIVNRKLAQLFGADNPAGRMLSLPTISVEIVGVASDTLTLPLKGESVHGLFPLHPVEENVGTDDLTRSGLPETRRPRRPRSDRPSGSPIRASPSPTPDYRPHIDQEISTETTLARLCARLSPLALIIACVGLYGTVAFKRRAAPTRSGCARRSAPPLGNRLDRAPRHSRDDRGRRGHRRAAGAPGCPTPREHCCSISDRAIRLRSPSPLLRSRSAQCSPA